MSKKTKIILLVVILILVIPLLLLALALGGVYYWMMNPDLSAYDHLQAPQISDKADETVITSSATGIPGEISGNAIAELFQKYYQLENVDKSKMPAPKARWEGEYDPTASTLKGEFALAVPQGTPNSKIWKYGITAEILHIGSYASEAPTVEKLKKYITEQGYEISGDHEEEYLKGPMWFLKGNPDKYQTIIRYPVKKISTDVAEEEQEEPEGEEEELEKEETTEAVPSDWNLYESAHQFSFYYPMSYTVNEKEDPENSSAFVVHILANDMPSPIMQITVYPDTATFALWEDATWEHFDKVKDSFKMTQIKYSELTNDEAMPLIASPSQAVVVALRDKNIAQLSEYIHPDKGVRFSPYATVDTTNDLIFTANQLDLDDLTVYLWGAYDAIGTEIKLTLDEYWDEFVFDKNFVHAETIRNNEIIGAGNSINNWAEIYPYGIMVEYYVPGTTADAEMDWKSLRLIFEAKKDTWYLVGIIHDQWTI